MYKRCGIVAFGHGGWRQHKSQVSLKFDSDVMVLAGGHKVPLMELLSFEKDALKIDLKKIKKMVNESTGFF